MSEFSRQANSPRPWQAAPDCGDSGHPAVYDKHGRKIALVFIEPAPPGSGRDAPDIHAANADRAQRDARLMAAAPAMAEALRAIALSYPVTEEGETLVSEARAALAAAGVQP